MNQPLCAPHSPLRSFVTLPAAFVTPHVHPFTAALKLHSPATHMARCSLRAHFRPLLPARLAGVAPSQALLTTLFCIAGISLTGCSGAGTARTPENLRHRVPPATLVPPGRALDAAEADAARDPACFALLGAGRSMEPIYTSGTAIVVREQSFLSLRPGVAVVYRNRHGAYVAHLVLEKSSRGWLALGLSNPETDDEFVTARNFVGVIKAAYAASPFPTLAARVPTSDRPPPGSVTASLR